MHTKSIVSSDAKKWPTQVTRINYLGVLLNTRLSDYAWQDLSYCANYQWFALSTFLFDQCGSLTSRRRLPCILTTCQTFDKIHAMELMNLIDMINCITRALPEEVFRRITISLCRRLRMCIDTVGILTNKCYKKLNVSWERQGYLHKTSIAYSLKHCVRVIDTVVLKQ